MVINGNYIIGRLSGENIIWFNERDSMNRHNLISTNTSINKIIKVILNTGNERRFIVGSRLFHNAFFRSTNTLIHCMKA
jgi:hypothetical protein